MIRLACILCLALAGCDRDFTEYELDARSFHADTLATIEKDSGIALPPGSKGLQYHYKPPIDPIIFSKIEIPAQARETMESRLATLTNITSQFPDKFANQRCKWWPSKFEGAVISRQAMNNGWYIETFLVREKEHLILYLKYFTI